LKKEKIMRSHFVHLDYPSIHPGVARAEQVVQNVRNMRASINGPRSLSTLLLAAVVAAMVVVADQMMVTWADGHLLAAWVALWAVGVAAVGLFAGVSRELAGKFWTRMDAWSASLAQRRSDERMWSIAQTDARLMAELHSAMSREDEALTSVNPAQSHAAKIIRERLNYI
jgi:hypothetical protein